LPGVGQNPQLPISEVVPTPRAESQGVKDVYRIIADVAVKVESTGLAEGVAIEEALQVGIIIPGSEIIEAG
jgi:hypothetical protein